LAATVRISERNGTDPGVPTDVVAIRYRTTDLVSGGPTGVLSSDRTGPLERPASGLATQDYPVNAFSFLKYHQLHVTVGPTGFIFNVRAYTNIGPDGAGVSGWGQGVAYWGTGTFVFWSTGTYTTPVQAVAGLQADNYILSGFESPHVGAYDTTHTMSIRVANYQINAGATFDYGYMPECLISYMVISPTCPALLTPGRTVTFAWDEN
jgi:hypothetical protein